MASPLEINAATPGQLIESGSAAAGAKSVTAVRQRPDQSTASPVTTDSTELSSLAGTLTAATRRAGSQSGFRSDVVARIRDAISSNNYRIDMEGLAGIIAGVLRGEGK
jgi:flagellar biosynthesis anti-sigma factor FlgM